MRWIKMMLALYETNMYSWIFMMIAHWNSSLHVDTLTYYPECNQYGIQDIFLFPNPIDY